MTASIAPPKTASLSILMPVYNERTTVERAAREVLDADYPLDRVQLVIVDDGSTDGTSELLDRCHWGDTVKVVREPANRGKGAALRTGIAHADGEFVAIMDADLEYDPADLALLLGPLLAGEAEVVFGRRAFEAQSAFSFWYVLGNKLVTLAANVLFNSWLSDIMTCHKAMRTDTLRALDLSQDGFAIESEITAKLLAHGQRIHEVPIHYRPRGRQDGKKITARDGLQVLRTLVALRIAAARGRT